MEFLYPTPAGTGEIRSGQQRLRLAAVAPGEPPPDLPGDGLATLLIGVAAHTPGVNSLSWEELTRWLEEATAPYDAESRTGFLLRQFRDYLPAVGITFFPGFQEEQLATVATALQRVSEFYEVAADLLDRFGEATTQGLTLLRQSRPEELLAGYFFRDYARPGTEGEYFLRLGFHLASAQFQIAYWFLPGSPPLERLLTALEVESPTAASLRGLRPEPLLRLWSPESEQLIPLDELEPGQVAGLKGQGLTAAIQVGRPFTALLGEGLVERLQTWTAELTEPLGPFLTDVIH